MPSAPLPAPPPPRWTREDAAALYGIDQWGQGHFGISDSGEVTVRLTGETPGEAGEISLRRIVREMRERGSQLPLLLRFRDILHSRIRELNESFREAIAEAGYGGCYCGVYPIKVNQQQRVLEAITAYGRRYHYGLEAGSKAELIAALAYLRDPDAYLVCNGYKDEEFIDLALQAQRMGSRVILVLEMPGELDLVLERSRLLDIEPVLGLRVRLTTRGSGHWSGSAGERSVFGLNPSQVMDAVDRLRDEGCLHTLRLLHYHQGSQIPDIGSIRQAAQEATRIYVDLVAEGAPMGLLDLGGGLAVDYDGTQSKSPSSSNYGIKEYCVDLVEIIKGTTDAAGVEHPDIITESGRAVVAYSSVLVFDILDTSSFEPPRHPGPLPADAHTTLRDLFEVEKMVAPATLQECYNNTLFYRDQLRSLFLHGSVSLRQRALGEKMFWHLVTRIARLAERESDLPEDLAEVRNSLVDFYYGNFSLFQSLPDSWAIDQVFPVLPIQRHLEEPTRRAVLADITCDCDGKLDRFITEKDGLVSLPVHRVELENEEYFMAVCLVGAYQETLGDLHNLLGDTNVVGIELEAGEIRYTHEIEGDSVSDVLSYVEYDPRELVERFRRAAEEAVGSGRITAGQRRLVMQAYQQGLRGYTYYEHL